jgi:Phosphoadenosine phosphosulfate reductase family
MKHVIAISGGKDSTCLALRLPEVEPRDYEFVYTPTRDEPPEMDAHWANLAKLLGKPLTRIENILGLDGLIFKQNALPNWRQRWCTRMLKIEPYAAYLMKQHECTSYVGLRADEPEREGGDYLDIPGVLMRFPFREWGWGLPEVLGYLKDRGVTIPARTDCLKCFFQRLIEWYEFWRAAFVDGSPKHKTAWEMGEYQELHMGHTFRSPGRDTWPASMEGLRKRFEAGDVPKDTRKDPLKEMQCRVCRL